MRRLITMLSVLTLLATACGSSESETATTTAAPTSAAPTTAAATTTAAPSTTAAATTEAPTTTAATEVVTGGLPVGLANAFRETTDVTSGRMEGSISVTGIPDIPGGEFAMTFSGAFDNRTGAFSFAMDLSALAAAAGDEIPAGFEDLLGEMEIRQIDEFAYVKFPLFTTMFGAGTEWIRMPADESADIAGGFSAGAAPMNPSDFLEPFGNGYGTVEELGVEDVRGESATHYRVTFDMERLAEELSAAELEELQAQGPLPFDELPMDIWVGADGLVRKFSFSMVGADLDLPADEQFGSMVMTFEMFDLGEDIVVEPPPADQVTDAEDLAFFDPSIFG